MQDLTPADVLIGLMHSNQQPWKKIVSEGQFKTWVPVAVSEGFEVAYCFGKKPTKIVSILDTLNENLRWNLGARVSDARNNLNRVLASPFKNFIPSFKLSQIPDAPAGVKGIEVKLTDLYATGRWKQLALINYFLKNTNCRFLVISTSASYLETNKMLQKLRQFKKPRVYAGPLYGALNQQFVSGAQIIIDRDFATEIMKFREKIPTHTLNDIGLGKLAMQLANTPTELPTLNIESLKKLQAITPNELAKNYHFRLKSNDEVTGERLDVGIFLELHKRIAKRNNTLTLESGEA